MDIEYIRGLVSEILGRRMIKIDTSQPSEEIAKFILTTVIGRRLNLISGKAQLEVIWSEIRNSKVITDFILTCANELVLRIGPVEFGELTQRLAASYCSSVGPFSVIDNDLLARLPGGGSAGSNYKDLLHDNPWYVFILLVETLDIKNNRKGNQ